MTTLVCIAPCANRLGEGPFWAPASGRLYWFDIKAAKIFALEASGALTAWPLPVRASAGAPMTDGRLILASEAGVGVFNPENADFVIASPFTPPPGFRSNDGKIDLAGRLWWSLMDDNGGQRSGFVRRFDGTDVAMLDGVHIANGLANSPDGRTLYLADSKKGVIWAFDLDATGALGERRVFAQTEPGASPDGMAVDVEGHVWNAHWGAWRMVRYRPDGSIDRTLRMPVEQPTSCAFGGPDLRTLYITSAYDGLSADALKDQPLAGGLFAVEVNTPGIALPPFAAGNLRPSLGV